MNLAHVINLQAFSVNLQIAHWRAPTKTNEHRALGDLYERIAELTDTLAEVAMGKSGGREFPTDSIEIETIEPSVLCAAGLDILADIRAELTAGQDDDLLNIVADMSAEINRTLYLLQP